ncbi:acyl-CoA thioesterase [Oceanobacillus caeni]|uniref:acyl-CoA thioesterase n=1 Tax=Oceanobacillus TaxID=182709 RepID=UPI000621DA8E|nr:thioesterase family protein [Oceanobacillus caeni]KKE80402.1 thioesterase [Bacilli bacterium VT-13-104]PZD83400.1 acyl-CoA thioesterase [Bacilli bacterium]MBU8792412.1 acyl-CoA thioesterase [Oceanobacillus caeni]MCR1834707.1 acyl-CoA thioesterase [Oceanobacillus caeni]PZD84579.1 acyl-CoA thioesterase [Bacilli bacterium]
MTDRWHQENMRVQYKDTDQMGVVHHGNYVTWFEVSRTEWIRHYGFAYSKMEEYGVLLPVLDVNIQYKKSAHYDDCVAVFSKVTKYSPVRIEFYYEVRKISEEEFAQEKGETMEPFGELLAKGTTKHMWVNQEWKPVRMNKVAPEIYEVLEKVMG